jgi:peptidoglycan hydrolase FlgJ
MSAAPINEAQIYGDMAGLQALRKGARENDPAAIREGARQFESLFARMMIKSMRDAVGKDPIFGSSQSELYQGMFDDQLAKQMTQGRGLGLADMLMRQLQHAGGGAAPTSPAASTNPAASASAAAPATTSAAAAPPASAADQEHFVQTLWPQAQEAGRELGVHPISLIAQAALESHWGRNTPKDASGAPSHNLLGVKAGSTWGGASVSASTQEFQSGALRDTQASFRVYASDAQAVRDYIATLRGAPRYAAALGTGADVRTFAAALQGAGYATDPDYVRKISAVAEQVRAVLDRTGAADAALKFQGDAPIASVAGSASKG